MREIRSCGGGVGFEREREWESASMSCPQAESE